MNTKKTTTRKNYKHTKWYNRMIGAMQLQSFSPRTQQSYVRAVRKLAEFYDKSPVRITEEELYQYFLHRKSVDQWSGTLGMLGVTQTWKRDLGYHPHTHYVIPGGGLASDGRTWCPARHDYLMPEKSVAIIFRAKFRDGLKALALYDQVPQAAWLKNWVVDIEPVGSGQEALKYLTPCIFRVAISNKNILKVTDQDVTFRYRDRKQPGYQTKTLPAEQFISRFLQHVLPKGFQRIRT